jgi:enamine deaminase RidA (YjgF/YER057c/UK114 family)
MSKRRNIEVPGLEHSNPIPLATMIGPFLVSGGIPGRDPATGKTGGDFETQVVLMFQNIRRVMEAAGGSTDDIIKVSVWINSGNSKQVLNREWTAMFPDEHSRPARHTFVYDDLPLDYQVQCEVQAVVG